MIVITFGVKEKKPIAVLGPTRGIGTVLLDRKDTPSIPDGISSTMKRFRNDNWFVYVEPGAVLHSPLSLINGKSWFDVAAYVERLGVPLKHGPFDGIGRVMLRTLVFRRSDSAVRVLDRWNERIRVHEKSESEGLLLALTDIKEASFCFLPPEYAWIESEMRPFHPSVEPRIEHNSSVQKFEHKPVAVKTVPKERKEPSQIEPRPAEVLWAGHLYDYSGYAKANREVIFRVSNSMNVRLDTSHQEPVSVDEYARARLDAFKGTLIGDRAPILRFFGPDFNSPGKRHRIVWTMMETYKIHPSMVKLVNEGFDELWTPTEWNRQVFVESGVTVPTRTIPLGVNPIVYRIQKRRKLPPCRLISTAKAALVASPEGFIFLSVGLPSFRKGFDAIADAMEIVFAKKPDVHLVIALTHSLADWNRKVYEQFARYKARVWVLEGSFDEHAMARIYSGSDCYVSASRGEGWNLPVCEAAACGIPVICPDNTSHPELVGKDAFTFSCEPPARCPEVEAVSGWYVGMPFSVIGKRSVSELASFMHFVRSQDSGVRVKTAALRQKMMSDWTWDKVAELVAARLIQVQP
jgi:glycosyltransferase involved in cell wall biosynthesis